MLPVLKALSVIDFKAIVVMSLVVVGLFMVFIQGGILADIIADMLEALNPF